MLLAIREILVDAFARLSGSGKPIVTPLSFVFVAIGHRGRLWPWPVGTPPGQAVEQYVLAADGKRALSDALVSLSVGAGYWLLTLAYLTRPAAGAGHCRGIIAWSGWTIIRDVSATITDAAVADIDQIARAARSIPGVEGVHNVRARGVSGALRVDLHVTVDPMMPVVEAHELTHQVREQVRREISGVTEVLVHVGAEPEPDHPVEE